jgi:hypothetical protein
MKKPRMGRPALPEGEARDIVFTLRLTEAERDALVSAAKRAGKPPTQWARESIVAAAVMA